MADPAQAAASMADPRTGLSAGPQGPVEDDLRHAMELLFFAYRDFTGEADAVLSDFGFGRAHHRALYFIGANRGISVSELLAILKITKQSLNRVLSALIDEGYVVQETDDGDRRRRLLHLTAKGSELEQLLARRQTARIARAYETAGPESASGFRRVLRALIDEKDRHRVPGAAFARP